MKTIIIDLVKAPKAFALSAFCLLFCSLACAQTDSAKNSCWRGGFDYIQFSGEQSNLNALNTLLSSYGYNRLISTNASWGGGIFKTITQ